MLSLKIIYAQITIHNRSPPSTISTIIPETSLYLYIKETLYLYILMRGWGCCVCLYIPSLGAKYFRKNLTVFLILHLQKPYTKDSKLSKDASNRLQTQVSARPPPAKNLPRMNHRPNQSQNVARTTGISLGPNIISRMF